MTPDQARDEIRAIHQLTAEARDVADDPNRGPYAIAADLEEIGGRIAHAAARIAGGEYRPAYNGWTNRETWNASLWIDNDQGTYETAREIIREACAGSDYDTRNVYTREQDRRYQLRVAGDALKDWYEETFAPIEQGSERAGPASDAWTYAVAVVDWFRIAEGMAEGMDPDPTEH